MVLSQLDIAVDGMKVRTSIQEPERRESVDDTNLLGGKSSNRSSRSSVDPIEVAEPEPVRSEPKVTGMTKQFSEEEVRDVASRVKDVMDNMDEETKQQAMDSARQMADALKGIVKSSQKAAEDAQPEPAAESQPAAKEPETTAGREDGMSPLAGMIEEDIKAQQAPEPSVPESTDAPSAAESEEKPEPAKAQQQTAQSSYASISKATAPEPLTESVK